MYDNIQRQIEDCDLKVKHRYFPLNNTASVVAAFKAQIVADDGGNEQQSQRLDKTLTLLGYTLFH